MPDFLIVNTHDFIQQLEDSDDFINIIEDREDVIITLCMCVPYYFKFHHSDQHLIAYNYMNLIEEYIMPTNEMLVLLSNGYISINLLTDFVEFLHNLGYVCDVEEITCGHNDV
jgi:hypothetical protein